MKEDPIALNKRVAMKMLERLEKEIKEWAIFQKELLDDYKLAKRGCAAQPKIQFLRRIQIRNFCTMAEAQIHVWSLFTRRFHRLLQAELSDGEIALLNEEAYDLDERGNVQARPLHLSAVKRFIFYSRTFEKIFCCSHHIDYSKEGWNRVKKVFKVRDRLMHPKLAKGVMVEDNEIILLGLAEEWFLSETKALFESQEDWSSIHEKCKTSPGLN